MNLRLLDEICDVGKLEPYREIIKMILIRIYQSGCTVSARYDVNYSNFQFNNGNAHIRISLLNTDQPLKILWRLLHEYGHFLSGPKQTGDTTVVREKLAWAYADRLLLDYPELLVHQKDYENCRAMDLQSYLNAY